MAGIYIHIPFCRRKCAYCDFYSVTLLNKEQAFVNALIHEITSMANNQPVKTIYFGGGTPSILSNTSIQHILKTINQNFTVFDDAEVTLEANPDDITIDKTKFWFDSGINRLSIGVQSLDDDVLKFLGRRHNAKSSLQSIDKAREAGFQNISADLIYSVPGMSTAAWKKSIQSILDTGIQHLSAYQLTVEKETLLKRKLEKGDFAMPDDEDAQQQFMALYDITEKNGFPWYEISNFARNEFKSCHNSAYWDDVHYLGFGPAAHAYDGNIRRWNVPDLNAYIDNPLQCYEEEILSRKDKINDYLITRLRTREGINLKFMEQIFKPFDIDSLKYKMKNWIKTAKAHQHGDFITLSPEGLFISDAILKDIIY